MKNNKEQLKNELKKVLGQNGEKPSVKAEVEVPTQIKFEKVVFPKSFKIENFPEEIKVKNFPEKVKVEKPEWYKEPTDKVFIKNFPEYPKEIKVSNLPKEVEIKKPSWLKQFDAGQFLIDLFKGLAEFYRRIVPIEVRLNRHEKADNALAVKVVNSKGKIIDEFGGQSQIITPGGGAGGGEASEFDIAEVTLSASDTDVSYTLPNKTRQFFIKARSQSLKLRLYKQSGGSYFTVPQNGWWAPNNLRLVNQTIILQATWSGGGTKTVEIMIFK